MANDIVTLILRRLLRSRLLPPPPLRHADDINRMATHRTELRFSLDITIITSQPVLLILLRLQYLID